MLDWSKKIEAVHTDGRVVPVALDPEYDAPDNSGNYTLMEEPAPDSWYTFTANGKSWIDESHDWTIRNVTPQSPTPEQRAMELVRRMALVAQGSPDAPGFYREARAICAGMEPVYVDLMAARECAAQAQLTSVAEVTRAGKMDDQPIVIAALAAIAKGRALERGEA